MMSQRDQWENQVQKVLCLELGKGVIPIHVTWYTTAMSRRRRDWESAPSSDNKLTQQAHATLQRGAHKSQACLSDKSEVS